MAFRFNVISIVFLFLLLSLTLAQSSKRSGNSKKKKARPPKLSENIVNNPFLHNRNSTTEEPNYQTNPFLTDTLKFPFPSSGSVGERNQPLVNTNPPKATTDRSVNVPKYKYNPFLQTRPPPALNNATSVHDETTSHTITEEKIDDKITSETNQYEVTKSKSELKCEEYGRIVSGTIDVLSLVGTNPGVITITDQKCNPSNRLVVGGVDASPGEFPHMVALGITTTDGIFSFSCGGTLIAPQWVLTAAHCTHGPKSPTNARVGVHNLNDTQQGISIAINKTMRHPSYVPPAMYADVALIKLSSTVVFNKQIRPACLYQQYGNVPAQALVTGWGVTEYGGEEESDELQKASLDIVGNLACALRHNQSIAIPFGILPSMICAGDPRGGWNKDACQGDSGGPLQIIHPENPCLFQVLGITSFGQGCAVVDTPGVYTRVSHYLSWIEENVWP